MISNLYFDPVIEQELYKIIATFKDLKPIAYSAPILLPKQLLTFTDSLYANVCASELCQHRFR